MLAKLLNRLKDPHVLTLLDQAQISGTSMIAGILIARGLGMEEFGRYALLITIILLALGVYRGVITMPMQTFLGQRPLHNEKTQTYLNVLMSLGAMTAFLAMALCGGVALVGNLITENWGLSPYALSGGLAAAMLCYQDFLRRQLFATGRTWAAFISDFIGYPSYVLLLLITLFTETLTLNTALLSFAATLSAGSLFAHYTSKQRWAWDSSAVRKHIKEHWHFGKWISGGALLRFTSNDVLIVAAATLLGASAAGGLRAAQQLTGLIAVVVMGFESLVPTRAAWLHKHEGYSAMWRYILKITGGAIGLTLLYFAVLITFAGPLVSLIYGAEFVSIIPLIYGYCAVMLLFVSIMSLRFALRTLEITRPLFTAYILTSLLTLILAKPLLETFGAFGVIIGLGVTLVMLHIWYGLALVRHQRKAKE